MEGYCDTKEYVKLAQRLCGGRFIAEIFIFVSQNALCLHKIELAELLFPAYDATSIFPTPSRNNAGNEKSHRLLS
jgi:hypothetical protein